MPHYYVNANDPATVHELDERNPRLDNLDNWTRYRTRKAALEGGDDYKGYVVEQGVLTRAGMKAAPTIAPRRDDDVPAPATTAGRAAPAADRVEGDSDVAPTPTPRPGAHSAS